MRDSTMKAALRIGAVTASAALALGAAGSAYAASPGGAKASTSASAKSTKSAGRSATEQGKLTAAKNLAASSIQSRLSTLHALALAVQDSKFLTPDEKSALGKKISSDISGLTMLQKKVSGATTAAAVNADETAVVDDFRVFLLLVPQVRLTDALAAEADAASTLQKADMALSDLLAKQNNGGTSKEKSELADLHKQIAAAQAAIRDKIAMVLAIRPGPDAKAIETALAPAGAAVKTARTDLLKARDDAMALRSSLKA